MQLQSKRAVAVAMGLAGLGVIPTVSADTTDAPTEHQKHDQALMDAWLSQVADVRAENAKAEKAYHQAVEAAKQKAEQEKTAYQQQVARVQAENAQKKTAYEEALKAANARNERKKALYLEAKMRYDNMTRIQRSKPSLIPLEEIGPEPKEPTYETVAEPTYAPIPKEPTYTSWENIPMWTEKKLPVMPDLPWWEPDANSSTSTNESVEPLAIRSYAEVVSSAREARNESHEGDNLVDGDNFFDKETITHSEEALTLAPRPMQTESALEATTPKTQDVSTETLNKEVSNDETPNKEVSNDETSNKEVSNEGTSNKEVSNEGTPNKEVSNKETTNKEVSNEGTSNKEGSNTQEGSEHKDASSTKPSVDNSKKDTDKKDTNTFPIDLPTESEMKKEKEKTTSGSQATIQGNKLVKVSWQDEKGKTLRADITVSPSSLPEHGEIAGYRFITTKQDTKTNTVIYIFQKDGNEAKGDAQADTKADAKADTKADTKANQDLDESRTTVYLSEQSKANKQYAYSPQTLAGQGQIVRTSEQEAKELGYSYIGADKEPNVTKTEYQSPSKSETSANTTKPNIQTTQANQLPKTGTTKQASAWLGAMSLFGAVGMMSVRRLRKKEHDAQ